MNILNEFCNGSLNVISLKHRKDRKDALIEHLDGSETEINFIEATYGAEMYDPQISLAPGWQGLRDTVIKIVTEAIENETEILSICEDDFRLVSGWENVFSDAISIKNIDIEVDDLEKPIYSVDPMTLEQSDTIAGYEKKTVNKEYTDLPDDWDVLHLGGVDGKWCSRPWSGNVFKVRDGLMGHFVFIKNRILQTWLDKMEEKPHLQPDVALSEVYSDMETYKAFRIDISYQDPKMVSDCVKTN
jgi:hypothetical protein